MSDLADNPPADQRMRAEFERMLEETRKFSAESHKLTSEALKLSAEQIKLSAEARKLDREHRLLPWSLMIALMTGFGLGLAQLAAHLAGWWR